MGAQETSLLSLSMQLKNKYFIITSLWNPNPQIDEERGCTLFSIVGTVYSTLKVLSGYPEAAAAFKASWMQQEESLMA